MVVVGSVELKLPSTWKHQLGTPPSCDPFGESQQLAITKT